jgi:hypothetical protein
MSKKVYVDLSQQDVQDIINAYEKDIEKFNKQKEVLDKIKEYVKNNEKCIVECSGRDFMTGMPYEKIKTGLIEKARIEELLEEIE